MGVSWVRLWWASCVVVGGWTCRSGAPPSQPLFTIRATSRQSWQLGHLGGNRWVPLAPAVSRAATSNPPPATGAHLHLPHARQVLVLGLPPQVAGPTQLRRQHKRNQQVTLSVSPSHTLAHSSGSSLFSFHSFGRVIFVWVFCPRVLYSLSKLAISIIWELTVRRC